MKADIEVIKSLCIIDDQECWLWTKALNASGYAQMHGTGLGIGTRGHRIMYYLVKGNLPEGMELDHLCKNRRCINPDHLEPVTPLENWRRGESPGRLNGLKTHCFKGHPFDEANTYWRKNGFRTCRTCKTILNREFARKRARQREAVRAVLIPPTGKLGDSETSEEANSDA